MKIIVTGGAGFIGSHLVDELINKGHKVSIIDNLSSGLLHNINKKAKFYKKDIREDISEIFEKEKTEVVFHLAAQMDVRKSIEDPIYDADVNVLGTLNILENMRKHDVKKIIFSSTGGAIYGDDVRIPTPEHEREKPISPYGVSKLSIEKYFQYYKKFFDIDFVSLRYANVYGPRQSSKGEAGVVAIFIDKILSEEQPIINGDGKQTRDFVYVKDVIKANILFLDKDVNGIFNVGTSVETNINQLFHKIIDIMDVNVKEVHGEAKKGEQRRSCLSYDKIKRNLGWKPEYDLERGLKETVDLFR